MKKDKLYLVIFLAIIILSGAVIYSLQISQSFPHDHPPLPEDQSQASVILINQISQLKKQLEMNQDNLDILVKLGDNYYDLNNPVESIKYYERALEIKPDIPEVMVDCGAMYRQLGEIDKALEMFTRAAKLAPDLPQAFFNLGAVLLSDKNDPQGAAEIWRKFLADNPDIKPELKAFFEEKIDQALRAR